MQQTPCGGCRDRCFFGFAEAGSNAGYSEFDHGMFMSGPQVDLIGQTHRLSPARAIRFQITKPTLSYRSLPRHRHDERPGVPLELEATLASAQDELPTRSSSSRRTKLHSSPAKSSTSTAVTLLSGVLFGRGGLLRARLN